MKLEINLPDFIGFYNTGLDDFEISDDIESYGDVTHEQYELIDWEAVHTSIGKNWLDKFWEQNNEYLRGFGISKMTFKFIDSPKYYNYSTDKLVLDVTFNKAKFQTAIRKFIAENQNEFESYIKDAYSSRSGFISFYSNDATEWIESLLKNELNDNVVFEGFLEFILSYDGTYNREEIFYDILENRYEHLYFQPCE